MRGERAKLKLLFLSFPLGGNPSEYRYMQPRDKERFRPGRNDTATNTLHRNLRKDFFISNNMMSSDLLDLKKAYS